MPYDMAEITANAIGSSPPDEKSMATTIVLFVEGGRPEALPLPQNGVGLGMAI